MRKSHSTGKLISISLLLITIIIASFACGPGKAPPSPAPGPATTPAPAGNQPPIISSLTAAQLQVHPSGTIELQCIAADPNGDKLNFTWSATAGNFSGAGSVVTWQAPTQYGAYTISVKVDDGKGASTQSSVNLSVGANQSPQIASLSANPAVIGMGGSAVITCTANDADGDVVRYSWKAIEGNISGVGNKVTWFPPNKGGAFNIQVIVNDGKGGESTGTVVVQVTSATKTATFTVIQEETGTVDSKGDKDKSKSRAGDDEKNVGYRAFWSFNIWSLNNAEIKDARVTFKTRSVSGNPFAFTGAESLGGLLIWRVAFADRLPDFNITGYKLDKTTPVIYEQPQIIDVLPEINYLVQAASTRFQLEAAFGKISNGNNVAEWIEWTEVKLEVTYTEK